MVPRLFASVQKLLQLGEFFLLSHRVCSPLFVWVGVSVGVNGVSFDVDQHA
jgi:sorbitol-specific phosphotransferase system component IIC